MMLKTLALLAVAPLALASAASANTQSGTFNGMAWTAQSLIIGMTPTGNVPLPGTGGGGDPLFFPSANKSGVVSLIMDYGAGGRFICSGSMLGDGVSVITAAHCINPRSGVKPITTAYFFQGDPDVRTPFGTAGIVANQQLINPGYTGQVIDHNDIAIVRLSKSAPGGTQLYDLYGGNDLTGLDFNVAGYGGRSTVGGNLGVDARTGFLREGDNNYDYRMGDPIFSLIPGNGWNTVFPANPNIAFSYLSDFDNGLSANDMGCRVAQASNLAQAAGAIFCDTGRGAREVGVAGGDSGGPQFVDGKIASVTSYGLSFGRNFGDCVTGLQSSCGEFSGYVPVYIHRDWIANAMAVPEPATWAMLISGFGLVGGALRRQRTLKAA